MGTKRIKGAPASAGALATAMLAVGAIGTPASAATAPAVEAQILFESFSPSQLDVLPGQTVQWSNTSERRHTVTADDGSFDSGDLFDGDRFSHEYDVVGAYAYHCTVHPGMTGEVDVRRVLLDPLPPAAVPRGQPVEFSGRVADAGAPVSVERAAGPGHVTVARATPARDGSWKVTVPASITGDYRATSGADASTIRRLLVTNRHVIVTATRGGVRVKVTPADPYARVVLELRLRERFGWWPSSRRRLDYLSRAGFRVRRPALVRVELVDRDGWTPLVTSAALRLRR